MSKQDGLQEALDNATGPVEVLYHYDGQVELRYNHTLHAYYREIEGQKVLVPNVTTVVGIIDKSPQLMQWSSNSTCQYIREKWDEFINLYEVNRDPCNHPVNPRVIDLEVLLNEARFNYRTISKNATDTGKLAHEYLEYVVKDLIKSGVSYKEWLHAIADSPNMPDDEKAMNCINAALGWMEKHNFRPMHSERKIYSRLYNYAGTLDWVGVVTSCGDEKCCPFIGEVMALGDFKSSRNLYDEYRVQTAAYQAAFEEEFPNVPIGARILMRLDKEGNGIETLCMTQEEFESDFDGFLGTLQTYNWQKQLDLNKRYEKSVVKAEKKAVKDAEKAAKPKRKPSRKAVIREFDPIPTEEVITT